VLSITTSNEGTGHSWNRRQFLTVGTAAIGGWTLPSLMAARAASGSTQVVHDRAVVVLNLQGGPTQFETFDPHLDAPSEIRGITGEVKTSLSGVTFGGTLPRLAAMADRMAIVRSYRHGISDHGKAAKHVMAGGNSTGAMMGALYSRVAGLTNSSTGLPRNVLVTSRAMGKEFQKLYFNSERVSEIGTLPAAYRPFDPSAGNELVENMRLHVAGGRLDDRRELLRQLDLLQRRYEADDRIETADRFQHLAFDVLTRSVADAFDISGEDPRLIERYDTSMCEPTDDVKRRNEYARQFSPVALGKQMLLARRLCEAGCGFVTVTCPGWDMHGGGQEFSMVDGLASLTPALDKAVSAFIEDVYQRGLNDKILLVITGEFGRTPRVNQHGGRDHWGNLCTLAFVGGGLRMGQVVGRSDRTGSEPASNPISSSNVMATIMHTLFDVGQLRLLPGVARDVQQVITSAEPIAELV